MKVEEPHEWKTAAPGPSWLRERLAELDMRPHIDPDGRLRELPAVLALKRGCRR